MAGIFGYQGQLGMSALGVSGAATQRFDFDSEELVVAEEYIDTNGLRGTRSRSKERILQGIRRVHGMIRFQPTVNELANLLPWIMGGAVVSNTYPLADSLQTRDVTIDRGSNVFTYTKCVVDTATFHASQNQALNVDLEIVGVEETVATAGSFPSLQLDIATQPFKFTDLVLVANSVTANCRQFELKIDNDIEKERFFNSQTLTAGYPKDRHITLSHGVPFGDGFALYNTGVDGVAATLTLSNTDSVFGDHTLTFSLVNVKYPRHSPRVERREEVFLPLTGTAYKLGENPGTLELVTTLV